ncbi:MAG: hypothetical protein ACIAXF_14700 [Phycisphaerales bacterium JB063]
MRKLLFVVPLLALTVSVPALAGDRGDSCDHEVVVRDSSSRYTTHDRLRPLTSTYLDTTSTRLIDARRGFRPYSTVHRDGRYVRPVRRSTFGIHPRSSYNARSRPQAERTGVLQFRGQGASGSAERADAASVASDTPMIIVIRDERPGRAQVEAPVQAEPAEPMRVTIYEGEPELPETSGAVIVRKDGTVISVGD